MRRILAIGVIAIFIMFVFIGCGNGKKNQPSGQDTKKTTVETSKSSETKETNNKNSSESKSDIPTNKYSDGSLSVSNDKSVGLPKEYPKDEFPIYDGSFIYSVIELNGSYTLTAYSKDDVQKVIPYYENVLKEAKKNMETKTDESLTSMGPKGTYAYTLDVGKTTEKGYQTTITISLQSIKEWKITKFN